MRAFANLYRDLDETTKTSEKVEAMARYFQAVSPAEAAWAVYFLSGRRPRQVVPSRLLRAWAVQQAGIPDWLFDESYDAVGDGAETMALLLPANNAGDDRPLDDWVEQHLLLMRELPEHEQRAAVLAAWSVMDRRQLLVWNKLITGSFRVGVSQQLVMRALAQVGGIDIAIVAHRLMGEWQPSAAFFQQLLAKDRQDADVSRPYPFCLAHPLDGAPEQLGDLTEWQLEWKWDGIRAQLIRRSGRTFLWSRGEELVTDRYPEIRAVGDRLPPGTVLDGEILPFRDGQVLPFGQLQRRIGRKMLTKKLLQEVPAVLMVFDVLEHDGVDVRDRPQHWRREALTGLVERVATNGVGLHLSPLVAATSWEDLAAQRQRSRERHVEGIMLKRLESPYRVGRVRGDWWKWKIEPFTMDAVLVYAQRGSGKRASLYTDYTFAVWDQGELVPVAKAYSGLTDEEIRQVDAFVRQHTIEKFGPVRSVQPELVFELGFEAIGPSPRHRSGVAVRFPRMLRWRTDKKPQDADTLATLHALIRAHTTLPPPRPVEQLELFPEFTPPDTIP